MSYITTLSLLAAAKAALEALQLPTDFGTGPLFERVEYFDTREVATALRSLTIIKNRVCFIVPSGDHYENSLLGSVHLRSRRSITFDLLIADRSWTKEGYDAVFGGEKNLGILRMKELVVDGLTGAKLGLDGVCLVPDDGSFISIADAKAKDTPGRECWVQPFETWAGEQRIAL